PDVLGLMGDAIDNIPGVTGIGEKTASALVRQLGPVEAILDHLDEVERSGVRGAKKIRETLAREAETARLSKALATIRCDVPICLDLAALRYPGPDPDKLRPLFAELEFSSLLRELAPGGPAADVEWTAVDTPEAITAALPALRAAGAMSVVATFDSVRATAARFSTSASARTRWIVSSASSRCPSPRCSRRWSWPASRSTSPRSPASRPSSERPSSD